MQQLAKAILSQEVSTKMLYNTTALHDLDVVPRREIPKPNILSFEASIGDAHFEGDNTQAAPAWKLLACQGEITNVETRDTTKYNFSSASYDNEIKEFNIPQIDLEADYTLLISPPRGGLQQELPSDFVSETGKFAGGNTIKLMRNDIVMYAEEMNTEILTENFDVEVFEMLEDTGVSTKATADLKVGPTVIAVGDTVTIRDGIETVVFEFIDNTTADRKRAEGFATGRVGVVVSDNYVMDNGTNFNRKGTIWNLMSAIKQDDGDDRHGYKTSSRQNDAGNLTKGRCRAQRGFPPGCYIGNHNLDLSISKTIIQKLNEWNFSSSGAYTVRITNNNLLQGNPNQPITTTASSTKISSSGFGGGYIAKGVELKRMYFTDTVEQVVDGFMMSATPQSVNMVRDLSEDTVEYYFKILTDNEVNAKIACSCANTFNKDSYYIDVDFDCTEEDAMEKIYYDIYGSATYPEICGPTNIDQGITNDPGAGDFANAAAADNSGQCEDN